jgi:hypothetical protein
VMLNIDGYLGESSFRELEWARMRAKRVFWTVDIRQDRKPGEEYTRSLLWPLSKGTWSELLDAVKNKSDG